MAIEIAKNGRVRETREMRIPVYAHIFWECEKEEERGTGTDSQRETKERMKERNRENKNDKTE
jgi:hypothetical protein